MAPITKSVPPGEDEGCCDTRRRLGENEEVQRRRLACCDDLDIRRLALVDNNDEGRRLKPADDCCVEERRRLKPAEGWERRRLQESLPCCYAEPTRPPVRRKRVTPLPATSAPVTAAPTILETLGFTATCKGPAVAPLQKEVTNVPDEQRKDECGNVVTNILSELGSTIPGSATSCGFGGNGGLGIALGKPERRLLEEPDANTTFVIEVIVQGDPGDCTTIMALTKAALAAEKSGPINVTIAIGNRTFNVMTEIGDVVPPNITCSDTPVPAVPKGVDDVATTISTMFAICIGSMMVVVVV